MKRFYNSCRKQRQQLSLLASGVLPESERVAAESHAASCPNCQRYYEQMLALSNALHSWNNSSPKVVPSPSWQTRWTRAVQNAECTDAISRKPHETLMGWRTWFTQPRLGWTSLAAAWLLILFFQLSAPEIPRTETHAAIPTPRQFLMALKSRGSWLANDADMPAPTTPPPILLAPKPAPLSPRSKLDEPTLGV